MGGGRQRARAGDRSRPAAAHSCLRRNDGGKRRNDGEVRDWRERDLEPHQRAIGGFGAGVERLGYAVGYQVEAFHDELADQRVGTLG